MSLTSFQRIRRMQRDEAMRPENIKAKEEVEEVVATPVVEEPKEEIKEEVVEEIKKPSRSKRK